MGSQRTLTGAPNTQPVGPVTPPTGFSNTVLPQQQPQGGGGFNLPQYGGGGGKPSGGMAPQANLPQFGNAQFNRPGGAQGGVNKRFIYGPGQQGQFGGY